MPGSPMQSFANVVIVAWGWRRLAIAFAAGAVSALAFAPFDLVPVLFLTLPVLVWLIDGAVPPAGANLPRRLMPAAAAGWWFGFGFFLAGLWWIGAAFLVEAEIFAWLMPFAVLILPAGLALFWAAGAALARAVWPQGWPRILVLALALAGVEWLRGHVFTGFPWNALGYALMPVPALMQIAALVGLWGVTLLAVAIFAAPATLADARPGRPRPWRFTALALALLAADAGYGALRLAGAPPDALAHVRVRVIQPAIDQRDKWAPDKAEAVFARYIELSRSATAPDRAGLEGVSFLVWPESSLPFVLTDTPSALSAIADMLPPGTHLVVGAVRIEPPVPGGTRRQAFNSVYVLGDDGVILQSYDKTHLVPFGEYLPFQDVMESIGLSQLAPMEGGFAPGLSRKTVTLPGLPAFAPLICYEIIFPGAVLPEGERPEWLLNVTNDAWYGDTPGPRQHLRQAVVRAVEEGLPLVRAANSGISAVVDPYGRIERRLELGTSGVIDADLPQAAAPTPYARWGDWLFLGLAGAFGFAAFAGTFTVKQGRN